MVDQTDIVVVSSEISSITNESFASTTVTQFSDIDGPSGVTFQMKSVKVSWNLGGGTMIKLGESNLLTVENKKHSTMKAKANVVDANELAGFNDYMMHHSSGSWNLDGTAEVDWFMKTKVKINKKFTLKGFNDFPIPPIVSETNLTEGTATDLYTQAHVEFTSTSNVQLTLNQPIYFQLQFNGEIIGKGYIPDYVLVPGKSSLLSYMTFSYQNEAQQKELMNLLSAYACGIDVDVVMKNFYISPSITWLSPALQSMEMTAPLPAATSPMIQQCTIYTNTTDFSKLPFSMTLYNPQGITVTLTSLKGNFTYENELIADVNLENLSPPIVIPPYSVITTPKLLPSHSYINNAAIDLFLSGGGYGETQNIIGGFFGDFPIEIFYQQSNVSLVLVS